MKLLSIDPGFERLGIAVISSEKGKLTLAASECFKTSAKIPFAERLAAIQEKVEDVIASHKPTALAIEKLFFSNNQTTAMRVAEARGVVVATAARHGLAVYEYTPGEIKVAVTGNGAAGKAAVMKMIPILIHMKTASSSDDEMDAIAVGLTCLARERL